MKGSYLDYFIGIRFPLEINPFEEGLLSYQEGWAITDHISGSYWVEPEESSDTDTFMCFFLWNDVWYWIFGDCYGINDYIVPPEDGDVEEIIEKMEMNLNLNDFKASLSPLIERGL